ncbi:MAG: hypothetical protein JW938_01760 [Candidatus Omnitrophica bacterium]|nr:hypothetical protein [Candidatus Omnitrophota bacterium]
MLRTTQNSGIVYIIALGIGMLIITVGVTYLGAMRLDTKIADSHYLMLKRQYDAQAGLYHMMAYLELLGANSLDSPVGYLYCDINNDSANDYRISYTASDHTCLVEVAGDTMYRKSLEAVLNNSGFTSAILAGRSIDYSGTVTQITGTINGNVRAYYQYSPNLAYASDLSLVGTIESFGLPSEGILKIPDVAGSGNLTLAYQSHASVTHMGDYVLSTDYMEDEQSYFVDGDVYINAQNVSITGFIVATGDIYIHTDADGFTLYADRSTNDYPALVAGGNIQFNHLLTGPLSDVRINGLVYARGNIYFDSVQNIVINGAVVARQNIYLDPVPEMLTDFTINYDPTLRPYNFTGGDSGPDHIEVVSWKGHSTD